jgi:uncharacterized membrane protein
MDEVKETGRLEGFSDGVFAVAITLLVLGLQPPAQPILDEGKLLSWLGSQFPHYLAFVTSFATIGVMWLNHHRMFNYIKRVDTTSMSLNLLLLLSIVFIPFPTALVAEYLTMPDHHTAAALFNGSYLFMAICFNVLFRYAAHENRLLGQEIDQSELQTMRGQFNLGPIPYLITFALTWVSVPVSLVLNLLLAVYWALPAHKRPTLARRTTSTGSNKIGTTGKEQEAED